MDRFIALERAHCVLYTWCMRIFRRKDIKRHSHVVKLFKISSNMYIYFFASIRFTFMFLKWNYRFPISIFSYFITIRRAPCYIPKCPFDLFLPNEFHSKAENRISSERGLSTAGAYALCVCPHIISTMLWPTYSLTMHSLAHEVY